MLDLFHINPASLILTFVVFGALLVVLSKFAWGPILKALDERDDTIRNDLDEAKQNKEDAQKLMEEHKQAMSELREESRKIREEAKVQAENQRVALVKAAEEEAERLVEKGRQQVEAEKAAIFDDIKALTVEVAVDLSQKLLKKEVDAAAHKSLIESSLSELENAYKKSA